MANILSLMVLLGLAALSLASQQTIRATGSFFCGSKPATSKDTWVKLLNKRTGFDDQIQKPVNDDGTYDITLTVDRWFSLTPELHVYTDCNDEKWGIPKGCERKMKIKIPDKYVNKGPYDVGRSNLENQLEDEGRDCEFKRSLGIGTVG
jgi:hypothetical protein